MSVNSMSVCKLKYDAANMHRIAPYKSPLIHQHRSHSPGIKKSTIERLSQPKTKDTRWIPDKPSVYWLDYIIDETPRKINDPERLAGYYDSFEPRYPRTRNLATPRKYYTDSYGEECIDQRISPVSGVQLSALTYTPTKRINKLAEPKTPTEELTWLDSPRPASTSKPASSGRGRSLPAKTSRPHKPKGRSIRFASKDDELGGGDFASRSQHGINSDDLNVKLQKSVSGFLMTNNNQGSGGGDGGNSIDRNANRIQSRSSRPKKK